MSKEALQLPAPLRMLAEVVGGEIIGDPEVLILSVGDLTTAKEGDLVFAWTKWNAKQAFASQAAAVVVPRELVRPEKPCLVVQNPRLAMVTLLECLFPPEPVTPFISPKAVIEEVQLGEGVFVGDFVFIGKGSVIGDDTVILPHADIGRNVYIGRSCRIHPFVVLYDGVTLGDRVIVHAGSVIGKDGFGFVWDGEKHRRIPQIGKVVIEDDVEIGANVCIDRATLGETRIKKGTKIDNLVQIAHNCLLGEHCILAGQTGLAGSVTVGNLVMMGGQVGVSDHVHIGDGAILAGGVGLMDDAPPQSQWAGFPARPRMKWLRIEATLSEIPEAIRLLRKLVKRVEELERQVKSRDAEEA